MTLPVSGPGPYSQRTDKQPIREPGGLPYGDNKALREQQQAAPMAQSNAAPPPTPIPMNAPSARPGQPVTAGADAGAGPDSSVLAQRPYGAPVGSPIIQALQRASGSDASGTLASLLVEAMKRGL
jgi:hypothetical protein